MFFERGARTDVQVDAAPDSDVAAEPDRSYTSAKPGLPLDGDPGYGADVPPSRGTRSFFLGAAHAVRGPARRRPRWIALGGALAVALVLALALSRGLLRQTAFPVALPKAPSPYAVPAGATVVSSSSALSSALAAGTRNIVLANGTYGNSSYFDDPGRSNIYAESLGGAVFTSGLAVGSNEAGRGAIIQGLAFDVNDPRLTLQNAEVDIWGAAGSDTQVLDSTFEGNWNVGVGLLALNPSGLVAQRDTFSDFTDEGIRASDNVPVPFGSPTPIINTISDITVNGVSRSTPGSSNGVAESGLWIGEPVANGVHRVKITNCAVSGIETVNNSWNTTFTDLTIDMSGPHASAGVAVYLEHFSRKDVFRNFMITGASDGFNAEYNDGIAGNGAAQYDTIEDGTIDASGWALPGNTAGVFLDQGTTAATVTNVTFRGQNWAGIGAYKIVGTNTFSHNTYVLAPSATDVSHAHV